MSPKEFVLKCYHDAKQVEIKTGLSALTILSQGAVESAWGNSAPGNMYFGRKDTDGINGNEQLLLTTEYLHTPDKKFPVNVSIVQIGKKLWKYRVKDWFRKYSTAEECFLAHADTFRLSLNFRKAWAVRGNPDRFFEEIEKAGYATAVDEKTGLPNYASTLKKIAKTITKIIEENGLS